MKAYFYNLKLIGEKEAIELEQKEGEKLIIALLQEKRRFVFVKEHLIAVSNIASIKKEYYLTEGNNENNPYPSKVMVEGKMSEEGKAIHYKFLEIVGKNEEFTKLE